MTDEVYRSIAHATSGFVEAPAGCGKTEAIIKTIKDHCTVPQLVLTHTNAGVDALRQRFKAYRVPQEKYHIDTIAGWAWGWVRKYPSNSEYTGSTSIADWNEVYAAMSRLLAKSFVRQGITNSYGGLIVDEYQDCTLAMHDLIVRLAEILPCRVLGDPLQGIFDFNGPLVGWADVTNAFSSNLGTLNVPHRWIKAANEPLGRWLLSVRPIFQQDREPNYTGSPIEHRAVTYSNLGPQLIGLTHAKEGRICVIGPKTRGLPAGLETALVNQKYRVLEPNELNSLKILIQSLADGNVTQKAAAAIKFIAGAYGGLDTSDKEFIEKLLKGENQSPRRTDRKVLREAYPGGVSPQLLIAILRYIERMGNSVCKHVESVSALKCILEKYFENPICLKTLYADEVVRRKNQSRSSVFRCIGSTLLVKGLEFDHAIILRGDGWGSKKDMYVALTRGSRSVTLIDVTR